MINNNNNNNTNIYKTHNVIIKIWFWGAEFATQTVILLIKWAFKITCFVLRDKQQ